MRSGDDWGLSTRKNIDVILHNSLICINPAIQQSINPRDAGAMIYRVHNNFISEIIMDRLRLNSRSALLYVLHNKINGAFMEGLNPVSTVTLADAVEKKICEYISRNMLKKGDALPGVEELARTLNVSRNILREALSRLRMLGLIETRKKRGMILAQPDGFIGLERMLSTGIVSKEYRNDLLDMRIILELGMTDYVFHRKTEKDIRELEAIISKGTHRKTARKEIEELEISFHSKLYEMSGNHVLKHLQGILRSFFTNMESNQRKPQISPAPPDHSDICRILKNGSSEEFREVMYKHLSVYRNY